MRAQYRDVEVPLGNGSHKSIDLLDYDDEVVAAIVDGHFDDAVKKRALELGFIHRGVF